LFVFVLRTETVPVPETTGSLVLRAPNVEQIRKQQKFRKKNVNYMEYWRVDKAPSPNAQCKMMLDRPNEFPKAKTSRYMKRRLFLDVDSLSLKQHFAFNGAVI
jgi:DNA-dependent RNA polymerase auxiliary subunit epsilon